jgi:hypothetical protein
VKFSSNSFDHKTDSNTAVLLEEVTLLNSAVSTVTTLNMASDLTNSDGNILLTSTSAQMIQHLGQAQTCKDGAGNPVGDATSRQTCTGLTGYTWTSGSPNTCKDADNSDVGDPSSQSACEGTDNGHGRVFTPLLSVSISSTNGGVSIESNVFQGGDMTSSSAITIATDANEFDVEDAKFENNAVSHKSDGSNILILEGTSFYDGAIGSDNAASTFEQSGDWTSSVGDILMTSTDAQAITHAGRDQTCKNAGGNPVGDATSRQTCTGLTGYTWTNGSPNTCKDADNSDVGDPSSESACEGTDNGLGHVFTPLGGDLIIKSANGAVKLEEFIATGSAITIANAGSIDSASSTTIEDLEFAANAITHEDSFVDIGTGERVASAVTFEQVVLQQTSMRSITQLSMGEANGDDLTNSAGNILLTSANAQAITHTGAGSAHLTISSTSGNVVVESVSFAGGALTSTSSITVDSDHANGVSLENARIISADIDNKAEATALTLEGVSFLDTAISLVSTVVMTSDLTLENTNSDILMTATGAQAITHTGASDAHLSITSTNGAVNVEDWRFTGAAATHTGTGALSVTSSSSGTVQVEGAQFSGDTIVQGAGDGPLTIEGVTFEDGAVGLSSIVAAESITFSKDNGVFSLSSTSAQVITHTGAGDADITISSTNGQACIEHVCTAGSSQTASSSMSIDSEDSGGVTVEDVKFVTNVLSHKSGGSNDMVVEDVTILNQAMTQASLSLDPKRINVGNALEVTNSATQTSGNLVSITGTAAQNALKVVTGVVKLGTNPGDVFEVDATTGIETLGLDIGTQTLAVGDAAATLNKIAGQITITGATYGANACSPDFTLTNSLCAASGAVVKMQVAHYAGTMFTNGVPSVGSITPAVGSWTFKLCNTHASQALSGNVKVNFLVLSPS